MLKDPSTKYQPAPRIILPNRQWPDHRISAPPIWLSTDLRDGNQAIFEPMDAATKIEFFQLLTKIGFKQIEVGFPAASQTEFDFMRELITKGHIPDDVTIQVLTQARADLIQKTMESVRGAKQAIIHFYIATSDTFRDIVLRKSQAQVIDMAVASTRQIKELAAQQPGTKFTLQFSPEHFSQTPLAYAREICDAVAETWGARPDNKIILNLPATVEVSGPNDYADMIEWMGNHLLCRSSAILSVHPHNDRGTAVAAAELAIQAGADRVEGCLLGNGERTGNVDLVTLAMNMYTQGIDPGLDFSNLNEIARTVERYTQIPTHQRQPYVGDLVFTAFSGSHQDAIRKGMAQADGNGPWRVPYTILDVRDVGGEFTNLIRVTSQSGKGGIAYVLEESQGIHMPQRLQVEFSGVVQKHAEALGTEISAGQIWDLFSKEYLTGNGPIKYISHHVLADSKPESVSLDLELNGQPLSIFGEGNGPINAVAHALKLPVTVQSFEEKSLAKGSDARAICFIEMSVDGTNGTHYGIGMDEDITIAAVQAVISGVNRAIQLGKLTLDEDYAAKASFGPSVPVRGGTAANQLTLKLA